MPQPTLASTALVMRVIGWTFVPAVLLMLVVYPHGFAWGIEENTQYHPYLWMMVTLYIAWCYLLVREAKIIPVHCWNLKCSAGVRSQF